MAKKFAAVMGSTVVGVRTSENRTYTHAVVLTKRVVDYTRDASGAITGESVSWDYEVLGYSGTRKLADQALTTWRNRMAWLAERHIDARGSWYKGGGYTKEDTYQDANDPNVVKTVYYVHFDVCKVIETQKRLRIGDQVTAICGACGSVKPLDQSCGCFDNNGQ